MTDVVTNAVKTVACNQGFQSLKFKNRHGFVFHNAGWIAGVDCNDNNKHKEDDDKERHHEETQDDQRKEELKEQERADPDEVDNIISDARESDAPVMREEEQQPEPQLEQPSAVHDQEDAHSMSDADEESQVAALESTRRST